MYKKGMRICKRNDTFIRTLLCMPQCRWSLTALSLRRQVRESTCNLWWMKWHWVRFFSKYFSFPVRTIPATHHTISFTYDQCYKTLATGSHFNNILQRQMLGKTINCTDKKNGRLYCRGAQIPRSKFSMAVPNMCGSAVRNLLHVTLLAPTILTQLQYFWKMCKPLL